MISKKEILERKTLSRNLIMTLCVLTGLLAGAAFTGMIINSKETVTWWAAPCMQFFFLLTGLMWGKIDAPENIRAIQAYIAAVACLCFLPNLFFKDFYFVSYPLFVGWALMIGKQLASWLERARIKDEEYI